MMVPRFPTATTVAVGLAAALASGGLAAQQPAQAQTPVSPATAKPAKPPKTPKPWPPPVEQLRQDRLKAEALPLFASLEPIDIVITADFQTVQRDRNVDSKKLYPGTLAIAKDGTPGPPIPIQLRTRGHVRRNPTLCEFAPLRLELPKDKVKGTVFEGHGGLKLGTHCMSEKVYEQYTLKDYLATRLHTALTPRALRTRLARVTYADTGNGKKPYTRLGILFEDVDDLAKRVEARELPVPRQLFKSVDRDQLLFMSFFQYMIGNTDYSIVKLHNIVMLDDVKGIRYTVPYDFDYSGLVNAHYATPMKELGIGSVEERLYRGPCVTEAEAQKALQVFREKQAELMALPASLTAFGLEDGPRKQAEKYLNEFFELIARPDRVKKTFVTDCKPVGGM
jgi:hypothetical protein